MLNRIKKILGIYNKLNYNYVVKRYAEADIGLQGGVYYICIPGQDLEFRKECKLMLKELYAFAGRVEVYTKEEYEIRLV